MINAKLVPPQQRSGPCSQSSSTCSSTIGVVLALAATTASAGRRSYEEIVASLSDGGPRGSYEITYGSSSEHYGGSIRCSSEAWAQSYSKFKSSYISAGAALALTHAP